MITISNKADCCGCTACMAICPKCCISMTTDNEGFRYPSIDTIVCINCGLCERACPIINHKEILNTPKIYGVINKDVSILKESTSGGAFWGLVEYVLCRSGVVYGAVYDDDFHVRHTRETSLDGCKKFHGAKYVESTIINSLFAAVKTDLENGVKVLFSGTPCQIAGLKGYLRKEYDNLLTCDLVCSSVPSPMVYFDFLRFVSQKKRIKKINMRWKGKGWLKTRPQYLFSDGSKETGTGYAQLWHTIAFSHLISRPSCHSCRYSNFNRQGDFSIGDFWGFENNYSDVDYKNGVSLLMVNSAKGRNVFNDVKQRFIVVESDIEHCRQPRLTSPVKSNILRSEFWNDYPKYSFEYVARKYWHYGFWNQLKYKTRRILSKIYHTIILR